jgi:glyoxylase-like metal-dependent hydrolase (beta-lactamase superfamily II)
VDAIDVGLLGLDGYGTTYVVRGTGGTALVEVGTSLCLPRLLAGLDALGVSPEAVTHILLTHIHLDHAGAIGHLVDEIPHAQVAIHSRSHRHLIDPTRLRVGVQAAVGPMFSLYGEIRPVAAARLIEGETLRLDLGGGVLVEAVPTPGHSPDHLVFFLPHAGLLLCGDAAGVSVLGHRWLCPVTAPPTFDLEKMLRSLETMRALRPASLGFTHFGRRDDPDAVFDELAALLQDWDEIVRTKGPESARPLIWAELRPPPDPPNDAVWQQLAQMILQGFLQYYGEGAGSA